MMNPARQRELTNTFRQLNGSGHLLLPNAWDAASACLFARTGFAAIGTTSAGIAFSRGYRDAQQISRDDMMREIANIVRVLDVPVTADIEAGYGPAIQDVADTVTQVLDAGVAGINLEDCALGGNAPLFDIDTQMSRLQAVRDTAASRDIELFVNARTDTFLQGLGADIEERIGMTIARGRAYLQAGADMVFIPGVTDTEIVKCLAIEIAGPISLMAWPGAPSAAALFAAGAARVSVGPAPMLATLGVVGAIAHEMQATGTWNTIGHSLMNFADAESLFAASPRNT